MRPSLRGVCQLDWGKQGLQRALPESAQQPRRARRAIAVMLISGAGETRVIGFASYPSRSCMRGLPRLRLVLSSKLNPPATFNLLLPLHARLQLLGSKTVFLGIVDLLKVAASPCTWLLAAALPHLA